MSAALMPVGGAAGATLTGVRWSNAINEYVKVEPASRLKVIADDKLKEAGLATELARRFVNRRSCADTTRPCRPSSISG